MATQDDVPFATRVQQLLEGIAYYIIVCYEPMICSPAKLTDISATISCPNPQPSMGLQGREPNDQFLVTTSYKETGK